MTRVGSDIPFLREKLVRPLGLIENERVTQYYEPNFGEGLNLRQVRWMREQQPYLRQFGINTL